MEASQKKMVIFWGCIVFPNDLSGIKGDDRSAIDLYKYGCLFFRTKMHMVK